jgi:hypothetical protein
LINNMTTLALNNQIDFRDFSTIAPSGYVTSWNRVLDSQYVARSSSISSGVDTALTFLTLKGVVVENTLAVENSLTNYNGIVAHLYEVPEKISRQFEASGLKLGAFSDPDSGDEHEEVYLEIETKLPPKEANERLSKLNREWLLASGDQDLMSLNLTLRFV